MRKALRVLPWLLLLAAVAAAYDGDGAGLSLLSRVTSGVPTRIAVVDPIGYFGLDTGLATYELGDSSSPRPLGHLFLPSPVFDLAVDADYAYIANGESGLAIIDVTTPASPSLLSSLPSTAPGGEARGIAIQGGLAYVAEAMVPGNRSRLRVIDISVPSLPRLIGSTLLPNRALDVVVSGGLALVALGSLDGNSNQGVLQVDVSDPTSPTTVVGGLLVTRKAVNEIALSGALAYLAIGHASSGAFVVADLSVPGAPIELGRVPLTDAALGVGARPGVALVAASSHGLMSFDVTDPTTPIALDALPSGRNAAAVGTLGDVALVAERSSIGAAGVSVVTTLFPAVLQAVAFVPAAEATAAATGPGVAYLLRRDGLDILDTSVPVLAAPLGSWRPASADFSGLAADGGLVAIGENRVVHLVDASDPAAPVAVGALTLGDGYALSLLLVGPTLYVVTGGGLEIFDVTSPGSPNALGVYATPQGWASAFVIDGALGYLAAGDTIYVLDLANAMAPALITTLTIAGEQIYGLAVNGSLLAAVGYSNFVYAIDATDPAAPVLRGFLGGGSGFDVVLRGDDAIIAAGGLGTLVIDLSDRLLPRLIAAYDTSGDVYDLAVAGDLVVLASLGAEHWLLWCDACAAGCVDSAPTIAANSLRVTRQPADSLFSWTLAAGWGGANLHRTPTPSALPGLWSDMSTLAVTTAAASVLETTPVAVGQPAFYRVFARSFCSGASLAP